MTTSPPTPDNPDENAFYAYNYQFDASLHPSLSSQPLAILQSASGQGGIGATIWDSGLVLARYLERVTAEEQEGRSNKSSQRRVNSVLELGCGTGLVGLVSARLFTHASQVHLTDKYIALAQRNIEDSAMGDRVKAIELPWGQSYLERGKKHGLLSNYDLVLMADVVHWPDLFQPLIETLDAVTSESSEILLAYERRIFRTRFRFSSCLERGFRLRTLKKISSIRTTPEARTFGSFVPKRSLKGRLNNSSPIPNLQQRRNLIAHRPTRRSRPRPHLTSPPHTTLINLLQPPQPTQRHRIPQFFIKQLQHLVHPTFATPTKRPQRGSADKHHFGSKSEGFEDVGSAADAAVEKDVGYICEGLVLGGGVGAEGVDDVGEGFDGRGCRVELACSVLKEKSRVSSSTTV